MQNKNDMSNYEGALHFFIHICVGVFILWNFRNDLPSAFSICSKKRGVSGGYGAKAV